MDTEERDFSSIDATPQSKRTNLLTYSNAHIERFPDCPAFAKYVLGAFESGKISARVVQWAVC